MAITQSSLTSGSDGTDSTTYTSASISPTANRLVIACFFGNSITAANAAAPTSVSGAGLTFDLVTSVANTTTGITLSMFRAMSSSPSSGTVTFTVSSTHGRALWSIFELDGIDTGGSNGSDAIVQTATNFDIGGSASSVTATLSAFSSSDNGAVSAHGRAAAGTGGGSATPDTGWTEIDDVSFVDTSSYGIETQWRADNDTTALATWSGTGGVFALAAEIKAAPPPPADVFVAWLTA